MILKTFRMSTEQSQRPCICLMVWDQRIWYKSIANAVLYSWLYFCLALLSLSLPSVGWFLCRWVCELIRVPLLLLGRAPPTSLVKITTAIIKMIVIITLIIIYWRQSTVYIYIYINRCTWFQFTDDFNNGMSSKICGCRVVLKMLTSAAATFMKLRRILMFRMQHLGALVLEVRAFKWFPLADDTNSTSSNEPWCLLTQIQNISHVTNLG